MNITQEVIKKLIVDRLSLLKTININDKWSLHHKNYDFVEGFLYAESPESSYEEFVRDNETELKKIYREAYEEAFNEVVK